MWFMAKATVPSPSFRLRRIVADKDAAALAGYRPKLTRNKHVVFNLRVNAALSASLYPDGWYVETADYAPRQNAPLTVHVFDMPEALIGEKVGWRIEMRETSVRQPLYESYTVIADAYGLPLLPYYRRDNRVDYTRPHPTDSYFSASRLSQVEWARVAFAEESAIGVLRVKVMKISLEEGRPLVREETVYFDEGPELANRDSSRFDAIPLQWHDALHALRERIRCTRSGCQGHYHSEQSE